MTDNSGSNLDCGWAVWHNEIDTAIRKVEYDLKKVGCLLDEGSKSKMATEPSNLIPVIRDKARALARQPNHKQELRQAVEKARGAHPDILNWVEPHPELVRMGFFEDVTPLCAVDDAEESLLHRVLAAIAHDSLTPRSIAKIAFHFQDGVQAYQSEEEPKEIEEFDTRAYYVHGVLSNVQAQPRIQSLNIQLLSRMLEALESLEAEWEKEASDASPHDVRSTVIVNRGSTIELPTHGKPIGTDGLADIFGVSQRTIQRRIKNGTLHADPIGRKWSVLLTDLPADYVQKAIQK